MREREERFFSLLPVTVVSEVAFFVVTPPEVGLVGNFRGLVQVGDDGDPIAHPVHGAGRPAQRVGPVVHEAVRRA